MPHIIGIDPSLKRTAVFVVNEAGEFVSRRCFPALQTGFGLGIKARVFRNQAVGRQVRDFLTPLVPTFIAFEGYAYGAKRPGHHDIVEHGYELRRMLCALEPQPLFVEVPPSTLKKHATGAGNAEKAAMISRMTKRFPDHFFESDDEADAAALALYALQVAGLAEPANDAQRSSLAAIMNPQPKVRKQKERVF